MKQKKTKTRKITRYQDSDFYFDDCAICQAMKTGEDRGYDLSLEELQAAFKKANKQKRVHN